MVADAPRRRQQARWWWWLVCVCLASCETCTGCGDGAVAELVVILGDVERDHAEQVGQWKTAKVGARFVSGDGVRTLTDAGATLSVRDGSTLRLGPMTVIRFVDAPDDQQGVELDMGEATLEASETGQARLHTALGLAVLEPGASLRLSANDNQRRLRLLMGQAQLVNAQGEPRTLQTDEALEVDIGEATLVVRSVDPADAGPEAESLDVGADAGADDAAQDTQGEDAAAEATGPDAGPPAEWETDGPERVELYVQAGQSFTVHTPAVPVRVGFIPPAGCEHGAAVRIRRRSARASGRVHMRLPRGLHPYRVFCVDEAGKRAGGPVASGRVRILRDPGVARLPKTAPASLVDADGRPYTVLYQNRLPSFVIRWPKAPPKGPYHLRFIKGRGPDMTSSKPSFELHGGQVSEGSHVFVVEAGERRSKPTRLTVRFDNVAPKASISSPDDESFQPGQTVQVTGIVLRGWQVQVHGATVPLDEQYRFDVATAAPKNTDAIAILLSHPKRGAHYYLRRARDAP